MHCKHFPVLEKRCSPARGSCFAAHVIRPFETVPTCCYYESLVAAAMITCPYSPINTHATKAWSGVKAEGSLQERRLLQRQAFIRQITREYPGMSSAVMQTFRGTGVENIQGFRGDSMRIPNSPLNCPKPNRAAL
ncbi:hypothetical protein FKM82_017478 [Ascaphus truei]